MKCSKCPNYSKQLGRCKQGKINPKTIKGGIEAVKVMGISYICVLSPLFDKVMNKVLKEV